MYVPDLRFHGAAGSSQRAPKPRHLSRASFRLQPGAVDLTPLPVDLYRVLDRPSVRFRQVAVQPA